MQYTRNKLKHSEPIITNCPITVKHICSDFYWYLHPHLLFYIDYYDSEFEINQYFF